MSSLQQTITEDFATTVGKEYKIKIPNKIYGTKGRNQFNYTQPATTGWTNSEN